MQKKAALLGYPVEHSLSPLIHGEWIRRYGLEAEYKAITVLPENLGHWAHSLADTGYAGFNLTLPHKVAVMEYCHSIDSLAQAIGAVNTVTIDDKGHLHGTNTDAYGFIANLRDQYPEWQADAGPVLVLGAGGAARAAVYALLQEGVTQVTLCNRNRDRAFALARESACRGRVNILDWEQREKALPTTALLVNTTSLGMDGQEALEIDLSGAECAVYDIVYRPLLTPLLQQAEQKNLKTITGLGMLVQQARPAFESWFGVLPEIDAALLEKIEQAAA